MARDFQDIQQLDSEENDHQLGRGTQLQMELQTLKETFSNFSSSLLMEMLTLSTRGGSAGDKVTSLEAKMEKQQQDLKADHATLRLHLKHFPRDVRTLTCRLVFLQSNGTECCPVNWVDYEGSCYWFSRSGKAWAEAEKYCQLENAHLVVINSREEQVTPSSSPRREETSGPRTLGGWKFIAQRTNPFQTWIGLTDSDGSWKWVDGTDYGNGYKNWGALQPDDWQGHELGGSEDCVEIQGDGRWNDDFCQQVKRWVCEMKQNITM
ncbi:asialoglycoprotein receptor 2 isoform X5 [Sus scrofa]|uniref:asialoglycoprotein receptor 2 isoform X5 n=1 Tax=Sus scrofa TaxID=9823 RepID=UPI0006B23620|nr:asialoglycoprotein receptor 2 isoform X5 [Sus scrofa]